MKLLGTFLFWLGCVGLAATDRLPLHISFRPMGILASLPLIVAGALLALSVTQDRRRPFAIRGVPRR